MKSVREEIANGVEATNMIGQLQWVFLRNKISKCIWIDRIPADEHLSLWWEEIRDDIIQQMEKPLHQVPNGMNEARTAIASHLNEIYYGKGYDPIWTDLYGGVRERIIKGVWQQVTRSVLTSHQGIIDDIEQKRP